ncbi:OmpA family protein [Streptomonospora nanhaiensis]|uniref:Outer membrane protein OmpA-like peptidoglycan-associated protein n=1 Tax=Streptomonospora nanhaiensis TaxID=1323731 RepID=A0A853BLZ2_9ACTN|nr:outer membrane protein OmpA-like peptidoglycan-associated protein [Streptomonospora nanhaiensis]
MNTEPSGGPSAGGNLTEGDVVAGSTTSSTEIGSEFRIDIHSLNRQNADVVTLDLTISNTSPTESVSIYAPPQQGEEPGDLQSLTLIDGANSKKHLPLLYEDGTCYCEAWHDTSLAPGESVRAWVAFPAPPADVEHMTFLSYATPPILDIPVTDSPGERVEEPAQELSTPQIWDVQSLEEGLEDNSTREETSEEVAISLSSDVLFDTNESSLDESANEVIQQVAREIDDSSARTVSVDGHTDNTGNDSVNIPLSEDRARAVRDALADLVEKEEISYEVAGHGAGQPIANNDSEEGRSKNRRVTITFAK